MKKFIIHIILFALLPALTTLGQIDPDKELTTGSKRAERKYREGVQAYRQLKYKQAEESLKHAIAFDHEFVEAYLLLGDLYLDTDQQQQAIKAYRKAIEVNPDFYIPAFKILGELELQQGQYKQALDRFKRFLDYEHISRREEKLVNKSIEQCRFALHQIENPVPFDPVNMGDSINSKDDEYVNAITADEEMFIFTVRTKPKTADFPGYQSKQEDFYISHRVDGKWSAATEIGYPINTPGNEGALCLSPDGQMLFITACNRPNGFGSCDIYYSRREGDSWSTPVNLGSKVNSSHWDSQPSISSDGRTLYFASTRSGGYGSSDIWKTTYTRESAWTKPENLGPNINTKDEEMAPFIHPDDQTLYYSSKGWMGMGDADLFYTRRDTAGKWQKPANLGFPINTHSAEINIVVNAVGNKAYLSSHKLGAKGNFDIYRFKLYDEAQPNRVTYLKGKVFDKKTGEPLEAHFELLDLSSGKTRVESYSDPKTGEFLVCLPVDQNYALNVSKEGYLFYSDHFALKESRTEKPYKKDIALQPIEEGATTVLNNIFFDLDEFKLKPQSKIELNKVVRFMKKNNRLHVRIAGHTDSIGSQAYNRELSMKRAQAVFNYLKDQSISKERLSYKGYGESRPIATNSTEAGRARNRRTEFVIIKDE
ncbi:MAG: OmpA family protein [Bacteroidales bacterium]|nr:OmpA family protein [Bacteroidales bacterium]